MEDDYSIWVECEVYIAKEPNFIGESSSIVPGEFVGWVSIGSDDLELSDKEMYKLLDNIHIEEEFARIVLENCLNSKQLTNPPKGGEYVPKNISIEGYISETYLRKIGDKDFVEMVKQYNTELTIN